MSDPSTPTTPLDRTAAGHGQRAMMRRFPTGVGVVTAYDAAGAPRGMTVSALCSVSLDPPTLVVCLRTGSPTLEAVASSGRFAINLLHGGASSVAELFASGAPDRFDRVRWERGPAGPDAAGPHLSRDAHTIADCRVSRVEQVGDHTVVFGETLHVTERPAPAPLVYGLREYRSWPSRELSGGRWNP